MWSFLKGMADANQVLDTACLAIFQSPTMDKGSKPQWGLPIWHMALTEDERLSDSLTFSPWTFLKSLKCFSPYEEELFISSAFIVRRKQMKAHDKDTKVHQCGHIWF